jgi:hypothetical protein
MGLLLSAGGASWDLPTGTSKGMEGALGGETAPPLGSRLGLKRVRAAMVRTASGPLPPHPPVWQAPAGGWAWSRAQRVSGRHGGEAGCSCGTWSSGARTVDTRRTRGQGGVAGQRRGETPQAAVAAVGSAAGPPSRGASARTAGAWWRRCPGPPHVCRRRRLLFAGSNGRGSAEVQGETATLQRWPDVLGHADGPAATRAASRRHCPAPSGESRRRRGGATGAACALQAPRGPGATAMACVCGSTVRPCRPSSPLTGGSRTSKRRRVGKACRRRRGLDAASTGGNPSRRSATPLREATEPRAGDDLLAGSVQRVPHRKPLIQRRIVRPTLQ